MAPAVAPSVLETIRQRGAAMGAQFQQTELDIIAAHTLWSPWDFQIAEANSVTVAAGASHTTVVSFTLPRGMIGLLEAFANGVVNLVQWDSLTWRVRVNGNPIPGLDNIQGAFGSVMAPKVVYWPLPSGAKLEVVASSSSAADFSNVTAVVLGRYFPAELVYREAVRVRSAPGIP